MKTKMLILASLCCWQFTFAQGIDFQPINTPWESILAKAKADNKAVYVHLKNGTESYVSRDDEAFKVIAQQSEMADFYNSQFVSVSISMDERQAFLEKKGIQFPAFVSDLFFDANGKLLDAVSSFNMEKNAIFYVNEAKKALNPNENLAGSIAKFDRSEVMDVKELEDLSLKTEIVGLHDKANTIALSYMKKQGKPWLTRDNINYIFRFSDQLEGELFQFLVKNRASFENFLSAEAVEDKIIRIATATAYSKFINRETKELKFEAAKSYIQKHLPTAEAAKVVSLMRIKYYDLKKDKAGKAEALVAHAEKYAPKTSYDYYKLAWEVTDGTSDPVKLEKALNWSLQAVKNTPQYPYLKCTAWIYYRLGKKAEAQDFIEKAFLKAGETGEQLFDGEEIKSKIAGM
jgi:hypothetical protein